jgi:hypothetical protein
MVFHSLWPILWHGLPALCVCWYCCTGNSPAHPAYLYTLLKIDKITDLWVGIKNLIKEIISFFLVHQNGFEVRVDSAEELNVKRSTSFHVSYENL